MLVVICCIWIEKSGRWGSNAVMSLATSLLEPVDPRYAGIMMAVVIIVAVVASTVSVVIVRLESIMNSR